VLLSLHPGQRGSTWRSIPFAETFSRTIDTFRVSDGSGGVGWWSVQKVTPAAVASGCWVLAATDRGGFSHPPGSPHFQPAAVRKALHTIDIHISERIDQARLLPKIAW